MGAVASPVGLWQQNEKKQPSFLLIFKHETFKMNKKSPGVTRKAGFKIHPRSHADTLQLQTHEKTVAESEGKPRSYNKSSFMTST